MWSQQPILAAAHHVHAPTHPVLVPLLQPAHQRRQLWRGHIRLTHCGAEVACEFCRPARGDLPAEGGAHRHRVAERRAVGGAGGSQRPQAVLKLGRPSEDDVVMELFEEVWPRRSSGGTTSSARPVAAAAFGRGALRAPSATAADRSGASRPRRRSASSASGGARRCSSRLARGARRAAGRGHCARVAMRSLCDWRSLRLRAGEAVSRSWPCRAAPASSARPHRARRRSARSRAGNPDRGSAPAHGPATPCTSP